MNKKFALGIAAAALSVTGVAGATISTHHSADVSPDAQEVSVGAHHDTPRGPNLNGIAGGLNGITGKVHGVAGKVHGIAGQVNGIAGRANGIAGRATGIAGGLVPSACGLELPVSVPLPTSTVAAADSAALGATATATQVAGSVPVPVALPQLPVGAPDIFGTLAALKHEIGCLAAGADGASPIPALCDVTAGLPVSLPDVPAPAKSLLNSIHADLLDLTNQHVALSSGRTTGVACHTRDLALPGPAPVSVPDMGVDATVHAPSPAAVTDLAPVDPDSVIAEAEGIVGTVTDIANPASVTGEVDGAVGTVTGLVSEAEKIAGDATGDVTGNLVGDTLDTVTGLLPGVPGLSTPSCSASAEGSTSLLGGLTASITGSCQ